MGLGSLRSLNGQFPPSGLSPAFILSQNPEGTGPHHTLRGRHAAPGREGKAPRWIDHWYSPSDLHGGLLAQDT